MMLHIGQKYCSVSHHQCLCSSNVRRMCGCFSVTNSNLLLPRTSLQCVTGHAGWQGHWVGASSSICKCINQTGICDGRFREVHGLLRGGLNPVSSVSGRSSVQGVTCSWCWVSLVCRLVAITHAHSHLERGHRPWSNAHEVGVAERYPAVKIYMSATTAVLLLKLY